MTFSKGYSKFSYKELIAINSQIKLITARQLNNQPQLIIRGN